MDDRTDYRVVQGNLVVAEVSGPRSKAFGEIMNYAVQYEQDGPVRVEERTYTGWEPVP